MPANKHNRPFESLSKEDFDDLLDTSQDDSDTIRKVLQEASARQYGGDVVSPVLDRFLHHALDSVLADYKELFDLFFDGAALEFFIDDTRAYLDDLETSRSDVEDYVEEDDEEQEECNRNALPDPSRGNTPMATMRFPVSEYYAAHVLEGITLSNQGGWWSAVLLIRDPKTLKPFLALYRWERKDGTWRNRKSFVIRDQSGVAKVISALNELKTKLPTT